MTQCVVEADFDGLADRLKARRRKLGLTHSKVHALGGPSVVTLRKMEAAEPVRRRIDTTYPLEQVYGWEPNAIDSFLDFGTEPRVVREPDYSETKIGTADLAGIPTEILEQALRERKASM